MNVSESQYKNNLLFYTMLKGLIQSKLTNSQNREAYRIAKDNANEDKDVFVSALKKNVFKKQDSKRCDDFFNLLSLINDANFQKWKDFFFFALDFLYIKPLLLEEAKLYASDKYENDISKVKDRLSLLYDSLSLEKPYGTRVISALLIFMISDSARTSELILDESKKKVDSLSAQINYLSATYEINVNNMLMIIMDESINQSITSDAGSSYESRVSDMLLKISKDIKDHVKDKNIESVEYDFTFMLDNKIYGISAKRTLRERYKQNFEDIHTLSVDAVFVITLGIDLNESKLSNILQRHGYYVVVSDEIYQANSYLKKNNRVISSKNFNKEYLIKYLSKYA